LGKGQDKVVVVDELKERVSGTSKYGNFGEKCQTTFLNVDKAMKCTYCEFSVEVQQRLSSRVDSPSLLARSVMRSTSSLASMHQW
jgi:hypothetical protein